MGTGGRCLCTDCLKVYSGVSKSFTSVMAGLGINLRRATGAWTPFSVITLEEIMTHLAASSQAYIEFDNVAFWKAGSQALLLMDVQLN